MTPRENERQLISKLMCPLYKGSVGWDFENNEDQPITLFLYCKNIDTCGIEVRKLGKLGWTTIIDYWKGLKG